MINQNEHRLRGRLGVEPRGPSPTWAGNVTLKRARPPRRRRACAVDDERRILSPWRMQT